MVRSSARVLGLLAFSVVVCLGYLVGIVNFLATLEENKCDMTYMYEFPQYTEIPISPEIDLKYKHYSLSAYSEGILTEKVRKMRFGGIPVLFIPGHSGSGKQVRSIASVALRKSVDESHLRHFFDFFSVDFNGEYSALFGGVLDAQTQYVLASLRRIMSLYPEKHRPRSVVIIGHSMGGMIAKGLYLQEGFDPGLISTIITLATPHQPVVLLDTYLHDYYTKVNTFWSTYPHGNTSIASIGGGTADIHVRSSLTRTDHVNICTSSSMIPAVWVSADHKSIVWCKRLIKVLVRILFDSVDPNTRHISASVAHRNSVLKYHLSERFGGKSYRVAQNLGSQIFSSEGAWLEYASLQGVLEYKSGVRETTHILIKILPLASNPQHEMIAIDTINVPGDHWLFACTASEFDGKKKFCQVGENLSGEARFLPSIKGKHLRTYLTLDELRSNKHTHVLITIPPHYEYFRISYDIYRPQDRISSISLLSLPLLSSFLPSPLSSPPLILSLSHDRVSLSHTLILDHMQYVWLAVRMRMIPHCDPAHSYHQSVATVRVPWSNQNTHHVIWRNVSSHTFPISLYDPRPGPSRDQVSVTFELDPSCRYLVTAHLSLLDSLRSFIFSYSPMLLSHMGALLLFLLAHQLGELGAGGSCSVFPVAMAQSGGRPSFAFRILTGVSCSVLVAPWVPGLLTPDTSRLYAQALDAAMVPVALYAAALSCVLLMGCMGLVALVMWGKTVNSLAVGFLAKILKGSTLYSEWSMKILEKLPGLVAALMLSIALNTCGGLAFALGLCLYFLKLVLLYEEIFEKILLLPWNVLKRYLINRMKRYRQSKRALATANSSPEVNAIETTASETKARATPSLSIEAKTNTSRETNLNTNQLIEADVSASQSNEAVPNASQSKEDVYCQNTRSSSEKTKIALETKSSRDEKIDHSKTNHKQIKGKLHSGKPSQNEQATSTKLNIMDEHDNVNVTANSSSVLDNGSGISSNQSDRSKTAIDENKKSNNSSVKNTNVIRSDSLNSNSGARPLVVRSNSVKTDEWSRPMVVKSDSEDDDDEVTFRDLNFHFTLFLLWMICTLVSFPSTLVWAKNFGDTMQLSPDPMSTHAAIMSACAALLWQADLPKPDADYYSLVSSIVYMTGCYVLLYAQTSLYRLIPAICFVFVVICSHQTITSVFRLRKTRPESPEEDEEDSRNNDDARDNRDTSRSDHGRKFRASHFTSVARSEEFVRDILDSQLNCLYKRLVRPFRGLVCSRRPAAGDSGDEIRIGDEGSEDEMESESLFDRREEEEENVNDSDLEENMSPHTHNRQESTENINKKVKDSKNNMKKTCNIGDEIRNDDSFTKREEDVEKLEEENEESVSHTHVKGSREPGKNVKVDENLKKSSDSLSDISVQTRSAVDFISEEVIRECTSHKNDASQNEESQIDQQKNEKKSFDFIGDLENENQKIKEQNSKLVSDKVNYPKFITSQPKDAFESPSTVEFETMKVKDVIRGPPTVKQEISIEEIKGITSEDERVSREASKGTRKEDKRISSQNKIITREDRLESKPVPVIGNKRKLDNLDKELCLCSEQLFPKFEKEEINPRPCIVSARNKRKLENLTKKKVTISVSDLPVLPDLSNLHRLEAVSDNSEEVPVKRGLCEIVSGKINEGKENLELGVKKMDNAFGKTVEPIVDKIINSIELGENVINRETKTEKATVGDSLKDMFGKVVPLRDKANEVKNHKPVLDTASIAGKSSQQNIQLVENLDKKLDQEISVVANVQTTMIDKVKSSQLDSNQDENLSDTLKSEKIDHENPNLNKLVISQVSKDEVEETDIRLEFDKQNKETDDLNTDKLVDKGSIENPTSGIEKVFESQGNSCDKDEDQVIEEVEEKHIETNTGSKSSRNRRKRRNRKKKGNTTNVDSKELIDNDSRDIVDNVDTVVVNEELLTDIISECDVNVSESSTKENLKGKRKSLKSDKKNDKGGESKADRRENLVHVDQATSSQTSRESTVDPTLASDDASSTDSKQSSNDTNSSFCELTHADVEENQSEAD